MIGIVYVIITAICSIISLTLLLRQFLVYQSKFNLELIFLSFGAAIWMLVFEILEFLPNMIDEHRELLADIAFMIILIVYLRIGVIFSKFGFSQLIKKSSMVAIVGLSMLLGLRLANILLEGDPIFPSPGDPVIFPIVSLIIVVAYLSVSIIFLQVNYFLYWKVYENVDREMDRITNYSILIVIIGILSVVIYGFMAYVIPSAVPSILPMVRISLGLSVFAILQYISVNPTILLSNQVNFDLLINDGYIGYFLISVKEDGPTILATSAPFDERHDLDPTRKMLFASTTVTVIGIGDSFKNSIFSVPFPKMNKINTISVSFTHPDPELKDPRMKQTANAIFSLIIPNNISPLISVNFDVLPIILRYIERSPTIEDLNHNEKLKKLTSILLQALI